MELNTIRVKNLRTIGQEQSVDFLGGLTIAGPNNSGKTNLLRAIQILFTGYENIYDYNRDIDLTFGVGRAQTSLVATFIGDPDGEDSQIYNLFDELHQLLNISRNGIKEISLNLYFTQTNTPVYRFFPNITKPQEVKEDGAKRAQYSRKEKQLVTELLSRFKCHYVPSAKNIEELYKDLLLPFLRESVASALAPHIHDLKRELDKIAEHLNNELKKADLSYIRASFSFPDRSIKKLISSFDFLLCDPEETSIFRKGMGIQSTSLLASFLWITKEEKSKGKSVIWLLEEPESYLHPELSLSCNSILNELRKESLVVITTHSIGFIPQNPKNIIGIELAKRRTKVAKFKTYFEATKELRESLGIRFSDFYNLAKYNILVEGPTDRELISLILKELSSNDQRENYDWKYLNEAKVLDYGGVRHLAGFLRATYVYVRKERAIIAIFDGDDTGTKERQNLQRYFGQNGIRFESNRDFVSTRNRFSIEGLFPDNWIIKIHQDHPNWFDDFSVDSSDQLEPFRIKDNFKKNLINELGFIVSRENDFEWAGRWIDFFSTINSALEKWDMDLYRSK